MGQFPLTAVLMVGLLLCTGQPGAQPGPPPDPDVLHLTLDQAVDLALADNRSVQVSHDNLESRNLTLASDRSAFDLKVAPSTGVGIVQGDSLFSAELGFQKKLFNGVTVTAAPGVGKADGQYAATVGLALEIPLLKGFGRQTNLDAVDRTLFSISTAEHALYLLKINTVVDTVRAVYDILNQNALVELFASHEQRLNRHVAAARIKEGVGLATAIDTYRARIRLKDVQDNLARVSEAHRNAVDSLKLILSIPQVQDVRVTAPMDLNLVRMDLQTALATAVDNRVELRMARENVAETERLAKIAKRNTLPDLDLVLDYSVLGRAAVLSDSLEAFDHIWSVNLESNTDWFRTAAKADYRKSLLAVNVAGLGLAGRQEEIQREVRQRLSDLGNLEDRMGIIQEQIHDAQGKLALAKVKFNHGMTDNFDVIEAETQLQQAHATLLSVKTNYIVGTYRLRAAMGTLLER